MDILLVTPPFTQLNTPYPGTAYLKGFLNTKDISSFQMDLGIEVIIELFSKDGLTKLFDRAKGLNRVKTENARRIFALRKEYIHTIDATVRFLQGKNHSLARQICSESLLPQASRFESIDDMEWAFGEMGLQDKAKHLATMYLEDISDFIVECVDENFGFSRYAERIGMSANSFDDLQSKLLGSKTFIDEISLKIFLTRIKNTTPKLVCFSVPFPGNLYSAFRCAQLLKEKFPEIKTAMGGGFPNTELRSIKDERVFEYFDFISLDDGELPIELIHQKVVLGNSDQTLKRTFQLEDGKVTYSNDASSSDYKQSEIGTPDYSDLLLDKYISVIEIANPMHSFWSDGRWNKLTMAHGCYWGKCTFCDISLDYIKLYEPIAAKMLVDRMEEIIKQTGENGFHFVDEAAPPALMKEVAMEIIRRSLTVSWWTNIRFEKSFTKDLCKLLDASGCIAISGGLEVASDRLLKLIDKGVTVEQVAQVCRNFTETGIMVHAYLMYGYPTQTVQETIDSLEMVRQMFELGIMQSGFWHQFALTAHSPIGMNPDAYGVMPDQNEITFANNDIQFQDKTGIDHEQFSAGLKKSIYNFMHGVGYEIPTDEWFDFSVPQTIISPNFIESSLTKKYSSIKSNSKILWLGDSGDIAFYSKTKKNKEIEFVRLTFHLKLEVLELTLRRDAGLWLNKILGEISLCKNGAVPLRQIITDYENKFGDFQSFWESQELLELQNSGLLLV
ncbi:MAG: hypothetical protein ACI8XB_001084 [Patiriisocius sp.]|jgi:hypothetical protein